MNKQKVILPLLLLLLGFIINTSCNNDTGKNDQDKQDTSGFTQANTEDVRTFYLIPSPEDMFSFTYEKELSYRADLLNPVENADKYIDTKSKEFNFGVYSADLAYSAAFDKYQETVRYLQVVRNLSDGIGISAVFDESLVNRIENIIEDKDSLVKVSSDTYFDIVKFLDKKDRKRTLALISAGGWLETLYIVCNSVDKYKKNSSTIQLIADQKIVFNNLMLYLEQNQDIRQIKEIIADFQGIKKIFDSLAVVQIENSKNNDNPNVIVVGNTTRIDITEQQFYDLKKTISQVRNKLTGNNVSL